MEFKIENSMMVHYRYNFLNGVNSKIKTKKIFNEWIPSELSQVSQEMVEELFTNKSGLYIDLSFLN